MLSVFKDFNYLCSAFSVICVTGYRHRFSNTSTHRQSWLPGKTTFVNSNFLKQNEFVSSFWQSACQYFHLGYDEYYNGACRPGGNYWDRYPGTLSCGLLIWRWRSGHVRVSRSSSDLQSRWLDFKMAFTAACHIRLMAWCRLCSDSDYWLTYASLGLDEIIILKCP